MPQLFMLLLLSLLLLSNVVGILAVAVNYEIVPQVLQGQIQGHVDGQDSVLVPAVGVRQKMLIPNGKRRKWHIEQEHQKHGTGHIGRALEGELAVANTLSKYFIVRIAWVFGVNGKNFIKTMLNVAKTHDTLKVVNDQIGTPTYTYDLARLLVDMIETDKYGYYHVTNEGGYISWYDFTKEIFRQAVEMGRTEYAEDAVKVLPVTTEEYGVSKAKRPFNSRLDKKKLVENGFVPLPTWQDALKRYLKEIEF